MFHPGPPTKIAEMVQSVGSWKPDKELPEGMSWHLKPLEQTSVRVPSRVAVNERLNRS
ncbi:hypothetical protein Tco_0584583, partial [Tanacetum coccineum]